MILCKNGHENEEGATYCRVCYVYIDSTTAEHVEVPPEPAEHVEAPPAEPGLPTIALGDREVVVPLGEERACEIWIRNGGSAEARYGVEVGGPAAEWSVVRDAPVTVAAGAEGKAAVVFRPPATEVASDPVPFVVTVTDLDHPEAVATGEGTVEVDVDVEVKIEAELVPVASRGATTGSHRVVVRNKGAIPVVAAVGARGADDAVSVTVEPETVTVAPAGEAAATARVRPLTPFTWGKPHVHLFDVLVTPAGGDPTALQGTMTQVARVPKWAAVVAALVAAAGGTAVAVDGGPDAPEFHDGEASFEPVPPEATECPQEIITEDRGSTGDLVTVLHTLLHQRDYFDEGNEALVSEAENQIYGPETTAAVAAFQGDHGVEPVDGDVGPITWNALCGV